MYLFGVQTGEERDSEVEAVFDAVRSGNFRSRRKTPVNSFRVLYPKQDVWEEIHT